jgi:hypothetical protein
MLFKRYLTKMMTDTAYESLMNRRNSNDNLLDTSGYATLYWQDFEPVYNDIVEAINDLAELNSLGSHNHDLLDMLVENILALYDEYNDVSGGTILKGFSDEVFRNMKTIEDVCLVLQLNRNNPRRALRELFGTL